MLIALAFAQFVSATFSLWLAVAIQRSARGDLIQEASSRGAGHAPGVGVFTWLLIAVAFWSALGGVHALAPTLAQKILLAKIQYLGIATVPPLWFLFTSEYARASWVGSRRVRILVWIIPAATVAAAFTNEWHHAIWNRISLSPDGFAVYDHGRLFWIAAAYNYGLALAGTVALIHTARRSPPPFRGQFIALVTAAVVPWIGNLLFLAGVTHPGFDLTPIGFTLSGILFGSALYRNQLFELVPVARDMVVDSLDDPVAVIGPTGRVLDLNAAALQLIHPAVTWVGRPVGALLPFLADAPFDPPQQRVVEVTSPADGAIRLYDVRAMPLRGRRGRSAGRVVLLRDVTAQHAAAAEREALQQRIQEQQRRESLSVLAGGLAHDFNNLLTGIVGNADLLAMRLPRSDDMGASVGAIQLAAQRAADLVSKMLAYAGERHGTPARVDLDALVREILDLLRASAGRHCTIEYAGCRAMVDADPTQIRQVAMNLIINAADAVDEGTGRVTVTTGVEALSAEQIGEMKFAEGATAGEHAFLEVRDNGAGMTEDTLRRIFQPFFTTKPQGHGLGLSAVQGIVRSHRGALRLESRPGWGSRFCVWFPLAADADEGEDKGEGERAGRAQAQEVS